MINVFYVFKFFECGKFCINYILRKDKIKRRVKYNGVMMSLGLVKRVLKEYYNNVECYEIDDIKMIPKDCVTLLKYGKRYFHYVVIRDIRDDTILYYDPLFLYQRKKKVNSFIKHWSHYCCIYGEKK